jgi:hypothetical protein
LSTAVGCASWIVGIVALVYVVRRQNLRHQAGRIVSVERGCSGSHGRIPRLTEYGEVVWMAQTYVPSRQGLERELEP